MGAGFADLHVRRRSAELVRQLAGKLASSLAIGLMFGLGSGLVLALAPRLVDGPTDGLLDTLVNGLAVGLALGLGLGLVFGLEGGLVEWAETPALFRQATAPTGSLRADRTLNLLRTVSHVLAVGLAVGLTIGLAVEVAPRLASGPVLGLAIGLGLGLAAALGASDHRAWPAYLVATWRLARAGLLPRRLMPFLDDCHRLGLLRAIGPFYQFRHGDFQDHLAVTYRPGS